MDPELAQLLTALGGGAAGELGRQLWGALGGLVRRMGTRSDDVPEFAELEAAPQSRAAAQALARRLTDRAAEEPTFAVQLADWQARAQVVMDHCAPGDVHNNFSGSATTVVQGRDFGSITFGGRPQAGEGGAHT